MDVLWTIIIGIIAGWLAGVIMKGGGYGVVTDLILGILGAVVGRVLFTSLNLAPYGILGSLGISVVGAVILIGIGRALQRV